MTVIRTMPQAGASYGNSATGITMLLNRPECLVAWKVFHKLKVGTVTPDRVTLYVLACALRPLHTWYPIQMESFDSRWERHQRRRQARDNDEAAPKKCGRKSCETAADGKTPLVSTPRKRRGQFQWNLEPKKDGTTIDPTVYSTPSKKVRCML